MNSSKPFPSTPFVLPSRTDWDILFQLLFDELLNPSLSVDLLAPEFIALITKVVAPEPADHRFHLPQQPVYQDASNPYNSQTTLENSSPVIPNDIFLRHSSYCCGTTTALTQNNVPNDQDHPLDNIIDELERLNYKDALTQACSIKAMQEELNEFEHLEVWELVPRPDKVMVITLKWIYKVKLDELGGIMKNKAHLVARGYRQEEGIDFKNFCSSG
ncbi:retrovirus-related pol polyprotein from transposon TNT 1-94 [Tanacetum coccineum]